MTREAPAPLQHDVPWVPGNREDGCLRHLCDTSATPPRHLRDTSQTPPRHLPDTSEAPRAPLLATPCAPPITSSPRPFSSLLFSSLLFSKGRTPLCLRAHRRLLTRPQGVRQTRPRHANDASTTCPRRVHDMSTTCPRHVPQVLARAGEPHRDAAGAGGGRRVGLRGAHSQTKEGPASLHLPRPSCGSSVSGTISAVLSVLTRHPHALARPTRAHPALRVACRGAPAWLTGCGEERYCPPFTPPLCVRVETLPHPLPPFPSPSQARAAASRQPRPRSFDHSSGYS